MDMYCFKFQVDADDHTEEWIENMKKCIEIDLLECRAWVCGQLWNNGWIDLSGYRFILNDDFRILVNENDGENYWKEHVVPSLDIELITKYINMFADDNSTWLILKQEDIHCA